MTLCTVLTHARLVAEVKISKEELASHGITNRNLEAIDSIYFGTRPDSVNGKPASYYGHPMREIDNSYADGSILLRQHEISYEAYCDSDCTWTPLHRMLMLTVDEFAHKHPNNKICMTLLHGYNWDIHGCTFKEEWILYDEFAPPFMDRANYIKMTYEKGYMDMDSLSMRGVCAVDTLTFKGGFYHKGDTVRWKEPHPKGDSYDYADKRLYTCWKSYPSKSKITISFYVYGKCVETLNTDAGKDDTIPSKIWRDVLATRLHKFSHSIAWSDADKMTDMRTCTRQSLTFPTKSNAVTFSNWKPYWNVFVPGRGVYYSKPNIDQHLLGYIEFHFFESHDSPYDDDWFVKVYEGCNVRRVSKIDELVKLGLLRDKGKDPSYLFGEVQEAKKEYFSIPYEELQERRRQAGLKTY